MNIADGMKAVTDNIIEARQCRVKALGNLVKDVSQSLADARSMIKSDAVARKAMSEEQSAKLARFAGGLATDVASKLKGFQQELEQMSKNRVLNARELRGQLRKQAGDLRRSVNKTLTDNHNDHAEMSADMRSNLRGYVRGIEKGVEDLTTTTRTMMTGYRTDIRKAGNLWRNMAHTSAKVGDKKAARPIIQAEEKVRTVKAAVRKIQKGKKKSKK